MDSRWIALGLFGLVSYQAGADPQGTKEGIGSFFTSANGVARQVPILFDADGTGTGTAPTPDGPGQQVVSLPDGQQVVLPAGYRVVPTGS